MYQRPVDGCGECITEKHHVLVHPYRVVIDRDRQGLRAWYRCPECLWSWWTSWHISALDSPCPGCPLCRTATETAA
jgi:hypothetical protein